MGRENWPVERGLNFSQMLADAGSQNISWDNNSLRVIEYNSTGSVLGERVSQFDAEAGYSASNAVGTLVFEMNGTTPAGTTRYYLVYFDSTASGAKSAPSYSSPLAYSWDGSDFGINNSKMKWLFDTSRGENTSGLWRAEGNTNLLFEGGSSSRTREYSEYSNATSNFSFNFSGNASFVSGPVRITVTHAGNEFFWNSSAPTGAARQVRKYYFYPNSPWYKLEQNITNVGASAITRNSTPAGALAFDALNSFGSGYQQVANSSGSGSWAFASPQFGGMGVGVIHANQSGTSNFAATSNSALGRVGVGLSETTINVAESITETALMHFNDTDANYSLVEDLRVSFTVPAAVVQGAAHNWNVTSLAQSQFAVYNRNETVVVKANVSSDVYNLSNYANATLDMGTAGAGDDISLVLYDDGTRGDAVSGDKVFTNNFTLNTTAQTGLWNLSVRVYQNQLLLSQNSSAFNVTGQYNLSSTVLNGIILTGQQINLSVAVRNFRADTLVPGATIACNYAHSTTDYANGTYLVNFSAPAQPGNYSVNCSAALYGNNGTTVSTFYAQAATTNLSVNASPASFNASNVTQAQNQSFNLTVNSTNNGNGTGYYANWSLSLPAGWSANATTFQCGNVSTSSSCAAAFSITIPNATAPGNYSANATIAWQNPDSSNSSNATSTTVSVASNPRLQVPETSFSSFVAPGVSKNAGTFTVQSIGNAALQNASFSAPGFTGFAFAFSPASISNLSAGGSQAVQINATANANHSTGTFNGTINVTTANGGYAEISLSLVVSGTNLSINASQPSFSVSNVTQSQNQSFNVTLNAANGGNVTAFFANLSFELPANWTSSPSSYGCGNLLISQNCNATFTVTVPSAAPPANYSINATASWLDQEIGARANKSAISVSVLSNPVLSLSAANVSGSAEHNSTTTLANFSITASGNDNLSGITYNIAGFPAAISVVSYPNTTTVAAGASTAIFLNATVPLSYLPGTYNGTLNVSTTNAGWQNVSVQLVVPENRSWATNATSCDRMESPNSGNACVIIVNNTGNIAANFSVTPSSANYSAANATSFAVQNQSAYALLFTYDVTGVPKQPYSANYAVSASGAGAGPNRTITINLVPFATIPLNASLSPPQVQQLGPVIIVANVTDSNNVGVINATATVSLPNSTQLYYNLTFLNKTGNVYFYSLNFSATALRGNYSVSLLAIDNIDVTGNATLSFSVYTKISPNFYSLSSNYQRGKMGSIYFRSRDAANNLLAGTNATITIRDSNSSLLYNQSLQTNAAGIIEPLPTFSLSSDAPTGNYSMSAFAEYYDANASRTVNGSFNNSFEVLPDATLFSGLLADIQTSDLVLGANTVAISISTYDANGTPLDPDTLNLSIFAPNDSIFNAAQIANLSRKAQGLYSHLLPINANATAGMYLVQANLSRGNFTTMRLGLFRISQTLLADVETAVAWYPQSTMEFDVLVHALDGKPLDADAMNLSVYDPAGTFLFAKNQSDFSRKTEGFYVYKYAMPLNVSIGYYVAYLNITRSNFSTQAVKPFRVSAGGPYDVKLDLIKNEVPQGGNLDFNVTLINMGPLDQDVFLEYWTTDGSKTWYYSSEAIFVGAGKNLSIIRTAFVYSAQQPGSYWLSARLNYSAAQPTIEVNKTFTVTTAPAAAAPSASRTAAAPAAPAAAAAATPTPTPAPKPSWTMDFTEFPQEVTGQSGETKYVKFTIKNTGMLSMHNLTMVLAGIPQGWIETKPSRVNTLGAGESATFITKISIPETAKEQALAVRALAVADEAKQEREFNVLIFESKLSMVEYELAKAEQGYKQLIKDVKTLKDANKDTADIDAAISEAYNYLSSGRDNLRKEQMDDALLDVRLAKKLVDKGTALLTASTYPSSVTAEQISLWFILSILLLLALLAVGAVWGYKPVKKGFRASILGEQITVGTSAGGGAGAIAVSVAQQVGGGMQKVQEAVQVIRDEDKKTLQARREKLLRVLDIIEEERKNGVLTESAFRELKKRNEKKLQDAENKLGI